jgi:hypothetical protein
VACVEASTNTRSFGRTAIESLDSFKKAELSGCQTAPEFVNHRFVA